MFQDQASRDMVTFSVIIRFELILKNSYSYWQAKKPNQMKKKSHAQIDRENLDTATTGPDFYLWGLGRWGRVMTKSTKDQPMSSKPRLSSAKAPGQHSKTCSMPTTWEAKQG